MLPENEQFENPHAIRARTARAHPVATHGTAKFHEGYSISGCVRGKFLYHFPKSRMPIVAGIGVRGFLQTQFQIVHNSQRPHCLALLALADYLMAPFGNCFWHLCFCITLAFLLFAGPAACEGNLVANPVAAERGSLSSEADWIVLQFTMPESGSFRSQSINTAIFRALLRNRASQRPAVRSCQFTVRINNHFPDLT